MPGDEQTAIAGSVWGLAALLSLGGGSFFTYQLVLGLTEGTAGKVVVSSVAILFIVLTLIALRSPRIGDAAGDAERTEGGNNR